MVLPAELLTVNYAAQVRRFLLERFSSVRLVLFEELIFPDVLEEVVLLLAEGNGGTSKFEVHQVRNLTDLNSIPIAKIPNATPSIQASHKFGFMPEGEQKWTPALVSTEALEAYQSLTEGGNFSRLLEWGETYLGAVTGNNDYFTLTHNLATELGLEDPELLKISPPGAKHLRGLVFSKAAWEHLAKEGKRCYLFCPDPEKPTESALQYIKKGERDGVERAYKCQNRRPWWRVPLVDKPDLFFTYMNHDQPRLTTNEAGAQLLNSLYGVSLRPENRAIGRELLPIACLNSLTLLGAEMVGRAYGGGMLKHEPKEADLLPVPSLVTIRKVAEELKALKPQLAAALRADDISRAVEQVDRIILRQHLGIREATIEAIRGAKNHLFQRRVSRARGDRGND
jgi:adenine-specific DNA methylase